MRDFAMLGDHRSRMHDPIPLIPVPSGSALLREVCLTCKICSKLVEHPMDSGCEDRECIFGATHSEMLDRLAGLRLDTT